ncbi:MAG TPA: amidase, partial [Tepidisphaeraceae bacterium]|nr:amidase [Tepidisphaeraceae bacterium]
KLDDERKAKGPRGPLHGIPVLIKDNIDTHDRMMTTAGSLALMGSIAPRDAFIVQKLRDAGAVILGKTNLSEWANFRGSRSTSGWSGRGGLTKNPYVLDRNPSGSSSGSAAAVSANLCAVAIGTETDGSIVSPATQCGIVGLKPTVGLWSRSGIIPISSTQDTPGPMARTVRDAAILLGALIGLDDRDPATEGSRDKAHRDYTQFLDADGLKGARIGVVRKTFKLTPRADRVMDKALETIKQQGAVLVDPADIPSQGKFGDAEYQLMLYEFKAGLNAYLANLTSSVAVRTMKDVIDFNEKNEEGELKWFGQEHFLKAQEKGPLTDKAYTDAVEKCRRLSRNEGIDAVMDKDKLDALVAPTGGVAGKTDLIYGDHGAGGTSSMAAMAGYPNITVPAGQVYGLPLGISFFGRAYSEPVLLKIAYAFEQATKARMVPQFISSIG